MEQIACSMGITAHNEEANIGRLLRRVQEQQLQRVTLTEIIVVASGCTDNTEAIVRDFAAGDSRIHLLVQERREGKASAINLFMRHAAERILVLCSADVLPQVDAIEKLVAPLADPEIGMTSCRPAPVNAPNSFMGFAAHLLWGLHHQINLRGFKAGEMTAYRKIFERIPYHTAVDEASVEPMIRGQGYQVRYVPEAVVYNKGPETAADFLRQRRRIYAGHLAVKEELSYSVSTMSGLKILRLLLGNLEWRPRPLVWTWCVVALEVYGRFLGWRDYKRKRDHSVWEVAKTTKELAGERGSGGAGEQRSSGAEREGEGVIL
ncbi:MAG: glycosyltransferase [Chloroflexi bacterium]|nr:glycosyltransferase [Chloroflexota bacterium]MCI0647899.1 glycosyltransferase [Chloroflexota bacterium]MCI0727150.1 glycosyltransferase [Chloroflexota bacterium]